MNARNAFSIRTTKEILRDPLTLAFGLGFPVVLLLLLTAIQRNIPVSLFELDRLTPGIAVFGLSFISLFSATLISKDRTTSFLMRLFASPMRASDYILGYTLPLIPMALAQALLCYAVAGILGMQITANVLLAILVSLPAAALFIGIGLLCGSVFNDKQVGAEWWTLWRRVSGGLDVAAQLRLLDDFAFNLQISDMNDDESSADVDESAARPVSGPLAMATP